MTAASATAPAPRSVRERRYGVFAIVLGLLSVLVFALGESGVQARFDLNLGTTFATVPVVVVPVAPTVWILGLAMAGIGAYQLTRGLGDRTVFGLIAVLLLFVAAFLVWAAGDSQLNVLSLARGTIRGAVPLTFGALAGVMCERSGVINIAIEAQLLTAAFGAAVGASVAADPWVGLLVGVVVGALIGWILAVLTIRFRADQIIVGVVLVVFATGLTSFLTTQLLSPNPQWNAPSRFPPVSIPFLSEIPIIGPLVFGQSVTVYLMLLTVLAVHVLLFRTRFGLRIRAVGEHPKAADTVGIDVHRIRYSAVVLGGAIAGMGGAYFTLDSAAQFSREMSAGRGFIALAAMLVGRYHPVGAFGAALIFGFAESLARSLGIVGVPIPSAFLLMAPYLATILVVAGIVGRVRVPAADGQPYVKE